MILTLVQCAIFFLFLFTQKSGNRISNRILASYLLIIFLSIFHNLYFRMELQSFLPHLAYQGLKVLYLSAPALYFYTKSLTRDDFRFKATDLLHLIPFFIFSLALLLLFDLKSLPDKMAILERRAFIFSATVSSLLLLGYYLQLIIYLILSLRILHRYQMRIRQVYSATEHINLSWLRFVLYGFLIIWIFDISMLIIKNMYSDWRIIYRYLEAISRTYTFSYILIFVFKGLKHPQIFHSSSNDALTTKYANSPLTAALKDTYLEKLLTYMEAERPYLNPTVSINQIAEALDILPKYLSQIINEQLGKNFFDFINSYRIEEAKKMLRENKQQRLTVLEILYEVGFNSKSSFNTAFKKATGQTPSQFRSSAFLKTSFTSG